MNKRYTTKNIQNPIFKQQFKGLWEFRNLVFEMARTSIKVTFKQTILGPIWLLIQPLIATLICTFVFGNLAGMSTSGVPKPLFYLSGIIFWNYFSDCLVKVSATFRDHQHLFGKIYFPRIVIPVSIMIALLPRLLIQTMLFLASLFLFSLKGFSIHPDKTMLLLPLYLGLIALQGLALGLSVAALTAKYRDLNFLLGFGIQLLMYASPVLYPVSSAARGLKTVLLLNPLTIVIEGFRFAFFSTGYFHWTAVLQAFITTIALLALGLKLFFIAEKQAAEVL